MLKKYHSSSPPCATFHPLKKPTTELKLTTKSLDIPVDVNSLPFAAGTASTRLRRAPPPATRRLATLRRRARRSASSAGTTRSAHSIATPTLSAIDEEARVGVSENTEKRVASPLSSRITCIRSCFVFCASSFSERTERYVSQVVIQIRFVFCS